ncbi:HPr family phosphocarrier protein [Candidatus Protochlamydia phocaeensis]|uniref:HPr family phosphocarrier protein n=1 Tax=Candidatus Protochlamydia phocaeensis TaxID=1414722 RepID=UPI000837D88A|nr:HPr family phosphocarrier protein [Candidatus Protochlamydia phocaeensis]
MTKANSKKKMVKGKFIISNDRGLHTRPSTELVKCANSFKSQVFLKYQKHAVNAKSLLGVLMLAASKGAKIGIEAEGEDAEQAVESIIELARNNFYIKY